jgi:hypothetical protein
MGDPALTQAPTPHYVYTTPAPLAQERKSALWDWYQQIKGPTLVTPPTPVQSAMTTVRRYGVGGITSAILAFIESDLGGLDVRGKYPIDGIAALALAALSVRDGASPDGLGGDFCAAGQTCESIYLYRKITEWRTSSKSGKSSKSLESENSFPNSASTQGVQHSGEDDALLARAKELGFYKKAA